MLAGYVYLQLDSEVRKQVQQKIAQHYPRLDVRVAAARIVEGEGIEIRGLAITDPQLGGPAAQLVAVEEIFVACDTGLCQLAQGTPRVCGLTVRRPTLRATRRHDHTWSVAQLLPLPKFGPRSPPAIIEHARVEIFETAANQAEPARQLTLSDVSLQLTPKGSALPCGTDKPPLEVRGTLTGEFFHHASVHGLLDPQKDRWQLNGTAQGVEVCPELFQALPAGLVDQLPTVGSYRAQATVHFEVDRDPLRSPPCQFRFKTELSHGQWKTPKLPEPLTDVTATIQGDNRQLMVESFSANCGSAALQLSGRRVGWQPQSRATLALEARCVPLGPALFAALPESLGGVWRRFQPVGQVDATVKLHFDGTAWHPDVVVRLQDVSLTCDKFPYRLDRGTGTVAFNDGTARFDLVAHSGDQPVAIEGQLADPGPSWTGWARVRGRNITVDERLIAALPEKGRQVVRGLNPSGASFHFDWHCRRGRGGLPIEACLANERGRPTGGRQNNGNALPAAIIGHAAVNKPCQELNLELAGGSIRYEKFPYPLDNVRGTVQWFEQRWEFGDLTANNDTGRVRLAGYLVPIQSGHELVLDINADNVPLDEELRGALRPELQRFWNELRPRGRINLKARSRNVTGQKNPDLNIVIEPIAECTSIEPVYFPWHLQNLRGAVTYQGGQVHWRRLRARHGNTTLSSAGHCQAQADGRWQLSLSRLNVDQLRADRDLLVALPPGLRRAVGQLAPTGPINMAGALSLARQGGPGAPITSQWDLRFELQQTDIDFGLELTNLRGSAQLQGTGDGERYQTRVELSIDSMNYRDVQLTGIRGPLWVDKQRILLGAWVGREEGSAPRHLTASLHGGALLGDGWVALGDRPRFFMQASLADGDLARFARERVRGRHRLKGKVYARVALQGTDRSVRALSGSGAIELRDADIYELPVIVALLKVLNARLPDTTAFTGSDMKFQIQGDHLYFDQLDLTGDAVNLYGKGTVDFQENLRLVFHTNFRQSDLPLPIVRSVLGQASQQILQVHVGGTFESPQIRNEPFPVMNQALQQIQADLGSTERQERQTRAANLGRWLPWGQQKVPR